MTSGEATETMTIEVKVIDDSMETIANIQCSDMTIMIAMIELAKVIAKVREISVCNVLDNLHALHHKQTLFEAICKVKEISEVSPDQL